MPKRKNLDPQGYRVITAEGLTAFKETPLNAIETIRTKAYDIGRMQGFTECEKLMLEQAKANGNAVNDTEKRTKAVTSILDSAGQYMEAAARLLMSEKNQL